MKNKVFLRSCYPHLSSSLPISFFPFIARDFVVLPFERRAYYLRTRFGAIRVHLRSILLF